MRADFLTVIIILYILVIAVKGAVKGFHGTVIPTVFLIALFGMTIFLSPKTYNVIKDSRTVDAYFEERAWDIVGSETEKIAAGVDYSLLQYIPISDELGTALQNGDADAIRSDSIQIYLKNTVKTILKYGAALLFTMFLSIVILLIAVVIVHKFIKLPGVRPIDRTMGFLLGLIEGLIGVWVMLAVTHLFEFTRAGDFILRHVQASPLLSMLDEYNLIYLAERYAMGLKLWN